MTSKELDKYQAIKKLIAREIKTGDAAKMIGCTPRHVKRLRNRIRQDDDATGKITQAGFTSSESVINAFSFWRGYVQNLGKPVAIYLDKFSTYKINHKNALDNSQMITQFGRACQELDINLICANSPQAKGRIERLFKTLQDRLVKELRLRHIDNPIQANRFLKEEFIPDFNRKFAVIPKKETDLHRRLPAAGSDELTSIFSIQSPRRIQNDFTIRFKNQWIQVGKEQTVTARRKDSVTIEERLDGDLAIRLRQGYLNYKILPDKPRKIKELIAAIPAKGKGHAPALDHPWKRKYAAQRVEI